MSKIPTWLKLAVLFALFPHVVYGEDFKPVHENKKICHTYNAERAELLGKLKQLELTYKEAIRIKSPTQTLILVEMEIEHTKNRVLFINRLMESTNNCVHSI